MPGRGPTRSAPKPLVALLAIWLVLLAIRKFWLRKAALRESRRLYRAIARNIPHGIVAVFDRSLRMLFVDGQGLDEIGLSRNEVEGSTPAAWPDAIRRIFEGEFRTALEGTATTAEMAFSGRVYLLHTIPLLNGLGVADKGLMLAEDITPLIEMQDELEEAKRGLEEANEELRQISETDPVLGISNRRKFDDVLAVEWRRAERVGGPISLLMIDVDFFKSFNDAYGHQRGDDCLRQVAWAIAGAAQRPGDLVARWGGDELVALLPETGAEGAREMAARIHQSVATAAIMHRDSGSGRCVTVSIGMASCVPSEGVRDADLVLAADDALYRAKSTGRNRTCIDAVACGCPKAG